MFALFLGMKLTDDWGVGFSDERGKDTRYKEYAR